MPTAPVSVIVPTHNRCTLCTKAVRSALEQTLSPAEVIVCDDASSDATEATFRAWAMEEPRLRYLRLPTNTGGPGAPRNAGLAEAAGEWAAFLDDDDTWLPDKLARQMAHADAADVIAGNARRSSGGLYFEGVRPRPSRRDLVSDNLVITSTAVVRTALMRRAGGFRTDGWIQGIEDYAAWLQLADLGARFLLLDDVLVAYRDAGEDRFGAAGAKVERQLARLHLSRWLRRPLDAAQLRAAGNAVASWRRAAAGS